jgi:hypothetical protein
MSDMIKLLSLYKDYNKLLHNEINDLVSYATVHGWKSENVEHGKKLREEIKNTEESIHKANDSKASAMNELIKMQKKLIDLLENQIECDASKDPGFELDEKETYKIYKTNIEIIEKIIKGESNDE